MSRDGKNPTGSWFYPNLSSQKSLVIHPPTPSFHRGVTEVQKGKVTRPVTHSECQASSRPPSLVVCQGTAPGTGSSLRAGSRVRGFFSAGPSLGPRMTKPASLTTSATTTGNQLVVESQMGVENPLRDVRSLLSPVLKITQFIRD